MVEVAHIKKKYGKKVVLEDVTFQIKCGEIVAIIGKNGCGKSTLLRILAGVSKADTGTISYYGEQQPRKRSKLCGYVPQENPLMEQLSVKDNLFLWGGKKALQQGWILEEFQLKELLSTPVEKLSGGMKRRLSIVCAILKMPPILLMDELTAALDFFYKEQIISWLQSYRRKNGIVIMATHEEQEIRMADRCFLMESGILKELKKEELSSDKIRELICEEYGGIECLTQ